ncbi:MAG: dependent oxidoreductase [Polaromonas sp.]|nr:dependent oxidoreductase [Polaromonas sp.]
MTKKSRTASSEPAAPRHIAVVGAGIAGITCARTLMQAGHRVSVFEKSRGAGGRMATRNTEFGGFDHGTQYFTVRDERFEEALTTAAGLVRPWSASKVRILDDRGRVVAASLPANEAHWVATPGMNALVRQWAQPLADAGRMVLDTRVVFIEVDKLDPRRWQLQTDGPGAGVHSGFDAVVLAIPAPQAHSLLRDAEQADSLTAELAGVNVAPCWTLLVAFPQALQPTLSSLGPQWNVARSTHHRIAWLARESSKPARGPIERWTVQASPEWSQRHLEDDAERVKGKLLRAFSEVTGIRAEAPYATVHRWRHAQTTKALGKTHAWDASARIGACGDWCLGHRVEDGFVSGLEMALAIL